jgi:AhpD family alkylhydroperoxidase
MGDTLAEFEKFRAEMNQEIHDGNHLGMKRFFALDRQAYEPGALPTKTKELLGLVVSSVLRCDDCITYHLTRCAAEGWRREEIIDASIAEVVMAKCMHDRHHFGRIQRWRAELRRAEPR